MGLVSKESRDDNDATLIASCQRGDRAAFARLYDCHKDRVYSIALHFFRGDEAAAADITQRVFLDLIDAISQFRGGALFTTWLYRIVINRCVDATRRDRSIEPSASLPSASPSPSPALELEKKQMTAIVQAAIAELPEPFRSAVLLRHFEELSYEEMAVALQCSPGTVASRLSRAHRLLAEKLAHIRDELRIEE